MAGITLAKALATFGRDLGAGTDYDRDRLIDYVTAALNYLLLNGGGDILREWSIPVSNSGVTVLPYDLSTPVKFRYGKTANMGSFASAFFPYSQSSLQRCCDYDDWNEQNFYVNPNKAATKNQPPLSGGRLIVTTRNPKDVGKSVMVGGTLRGQPIAGMHQGYKTSGELLTVYHESDKNKKYSSYSFDTVTHVTKDLTCDYIMLSGIQPDNTPFFLSHYHPDETTPQYTQIVARNCPACYSGEMPLLQILGRINPHIRYIRDEDILPIGSEEMLKLLSLRSRYQDAGNFNEKAAIEADIARLIRVSIEYQQPPRRSVSISMRGSGGTLTNL